MKNLIILFCLALCGHIVQAQQTINAVSFNQTFENDRMNNFFLRGEKVSNGFVLYTTEVRTQLNLGRYVSRIVKKSNNAEETIWQDTCFISGSFREGSNVVLALETRTNNRCSLLVHNLLTDSITIAPVSFPGQVPSYRITGLTPLANGLGALAFSSAGTSSPGKNIWLFNIEDGSMVQTFSHNDPTFPTFVFKLERDVNPDRINVYNYIGSNLVKEHISISQQRVTGRVHIFQHPDTMDLDESIFVTSTTNPDYHYLTFNSDNLAPRVSLVNNQRQIIVSLARVYRIGVGHNTNMNGDIFFGVREIVDSRNMMFYHLRRYDATGNVVWSKQLDSLDNYSLNRFEYRGANNIIYSAEVQENGNLLIAGEKKNLDPNISIYSSYSIPYIMEISNAGQPWRPGMVVSSNERQKLLSYALYPNPAAKRVKLLFNVEEVKSPLLAEVYSLTGSRIASYPLLSNETELDISGLSSGVYLVKVAGAETKKLVVTE